jgi:lipopolysaccharide export LptBFGC system permease protein LptF
MNNTGADVAGAMTANGSPSWMAGFDRSFAGWITQHGTLTVAVLVAAYVLIGLAVLHRRTIAAGAAAGLLLALAIWVVAQNFGALYTGQATDPNTAPLIMVMAVALLAGYRRPREFADRLWRRS